MRVNPQAFYRYDPLRPVDWRHQLALRAVTAGRPLHWSGDRRTRRWLKFLRRLHASHAEPEASQQQFPVLTEVYRLKQNIDRSALLEPYVLARESNEQLAQRFGLPVAVVACYQRFHFHVDDRLDARWWIGRAIGWSTRREVGRSGLSPEQVRQTWRALGYFRGPLVLDQVVDALGAGAPTPAVDLLEWVASGSQRQRLTRAAIAAYWLPPAASPMELLTRAEQLRRAAPVAAEAPRAEAARWRRPAPRRAALPRAARRRAARRRFPGQFAGAGRRRAAHPTGAPLASGLRGRVSRSEELKI